MGPVAVTDDGKDISAKTYWDDVSERTPSYYLIPSLADYKNSEYIDLVKRWANERCETILITDLYEAANKNTGLLKYLRGISQKLLAMDISPKFCLRADRNLKGQNIQADIIATDALNIALADQSVDLVISPSTFDHFPEIDQALSECYRILRPKGKLVLALNSADNPFFRLGVRLAEKFKKYEYRTDYFYTIKETTSLLKRSGFKIGRNTSIMHIPIGLTTVIEVLSASDSRLGRAAIKLLIKACQVWGRRDTRIKLHTGWWVVLEAIK